MLAASSGPLVGGSRSSVAEGSLVRGMLVAFARDLPKPNLDRGVEGESLAQLQVLGDGRLSSRKWSWPSLLAGKLLALVLLTIWGCGPRFARVYRECFFTGILCGSRLRGGSGRVSSSHGGDGRAPDDRSGAVKLARQCSSVERRWMLGGRTAAPNEPGASRLTRCSRVRRLCSSYCL